MDAVAEQNRTYLPAPECSQDEISMHSMYLQMAAGALPGWPHQPIAKSLADVGNHFGVSERAAAGWRARGMPGEQGRYPIYEIAFWRIRNVERRPGDYTDERDCGLLARAIYRVFAVEMESRIKKAADKFLASVCEHGQDIARETMKEAFVAACRTSLESMLPNEKQVDQIIEECQELLPRALC